MCFCYTFRDTDGERYFFFDGKLGKLFFEKFGDKELKNREVKKLKYNSEANQLEVLYYGDTGTKKHIISLSSYGTNMVRINHLLTYF